VQTDPSYRLLACQYLRTQLDALIEQVYGVRENKDIEPVHQARVASRRMRAGLDMFDDCFDAKKAGQWRKRIRRLTKGLGLARDLDVQIRFLDGFLAGLNEKDRRHGPGVERLLLRLRQGRQDVQPKVIKTLDALQKGNLMAEMAGELEKELFQLRHGGVSLQSPYAYERAAAHIRERKRDLLSHEHTLADPADTDGHHQLRIDAKRLRYTMEICDPVYEGQLAPVIKAVKKVQSLLGDVHDCDVWVEHVQNFMEQERTRTIEYFGHHGPFNRFKPGLQLLIDERLRHRQEAFGQLVEHWRKLDEQRLWDMLEAVLQAPLERLAEPQVEMKDTATSGTEEQAEDGSAD